MSSQINSPILPNRVSNGRTSVPGSTKRASSKTPYVGRNIFRWTCRGCQAPPSGVR